MDDGIAGHLAATDLTTVGLFSVTHKRDGSLATGENGYRRITGPVGDAIMAGARDRGVRTELVYTSFGEKKNATVLHRARPPATRAIAELVALAGQLGVNGINVDVELLGAEHVAAYGEFVGQLREALRAAIPDAEVSVATTANLRGAAMAARRVARRRRPDLHDGLRLPRRPARSRARRRRSGGGTAARRRSAGRSTSTSPPAFRRSGRSSVCRCTASSGRSTGPRSGRRRPVGATSGSRAATSTRWRRPTSQPGYDPIEDVAVLAVPNGDRWQAVYYDSPASLTPKLALADRRGLAGAGFWAVGYERGLPDYTSLIATFRSGGLVDTAP